MMTKAKIKVFELKKFDGVANRVPFLEIKKNLFQCERIDLIPKERIVKLNIPWGELYCVCDQNEWDEIYKILNNSGVPVRKWSTLYFFLGIWRPLFIFIIYLLLIIVILIRYIRFVIK